MDIFIRVNLSQVRSYVIGYYLVRTFSCVLEELVIVPNLIAKIIRYLAYCKVIEHSKASRQHKGLLKELSIGLEIIFYVTFLRKEL